MVYDKEMEEIREKMRKYKETIPPHTYEMDEHIEKLRKICANPVVIAAYNDAVSKAHPTVESGDPNPWLYTSIEDFINYFDVWFTDLPKPTGGLGFIFPFSWMYNENYTAYYFLNEFKSNALTSNFTKEIFNWTAEFILIRGRFMDSSDSAPKELMDQWTSDPNTHIEDFKVPHGGFKSFNEFFTRELNPKKDPRPISSPEQDDIVVASADTIINFILSDLTLETDINVKGRQISMKRLLDDSKYAKHFVGGTAVSCVLMPNVYHHYHAPVGGEVVESREIPGIYNGIMDGEHWFNDMSNPGQGNTDFSAFEDFHRAYYVIWTGSYGHVAIVPVGLNTISRIQPSLVPNKDFMVPPDGTPVKISKGDKLGNFAYGGSLNILMFEKGVFPCVSLLMGNRLGQMYPIADDDDNDHESIGQKVSNFVSSFSRPAVVRPPLFGKGKRSKGRHSFF